MKKLITLAAALIGLAGYQPNTQAIPSLDVEYAQDNWAYHLRIDPIDLPLGTFYALQIDSTILGDGSMLEYTGANGGFILLSGGYIDPQQLVTSIGLHTTRLYYGDFDTFVDGPTYTVTQPTGIRPGTPVPESTHTLAFASLAFIALCVLRKTASLNPV